MVPTTPDQIASATARRRFGRHFRGLGAGHKVIGPVEGDKIVEMWLFSADQEAEDAFWGKA